jgi:hypothetical protein
VSGFPVKFDYRTVLFGFGMVNIVKNKMADHSQLITGLVI